jgi:hypothetical protein
MPGAGVPFSYVHQVSSDLNSPVTKFQIFCRLSAVPGDYSPPQWKAK